MLFELIADRFNYAIVIVLMMAGLYVLFSSGNLVKKLVGLSVFQTSVFLLYISMAKVSGGQPPILDPDYGYENGYGTGEVVETYAGDAHDGHAAVESAPETSDAPQPAEPAEPVAAEPVETPDANMAAADGTDAELAPDALAGTADAADEDAEDAVDAPQIAADADPQDETPAGAAADDGAAQEMASPGTTAQPTVVYTSDSDDQSFRRYSNPLPHVLILTAIVVGVATLAVGLSLVVRIREVYGTIEDDEISAADYDSVAGSAR